MRMRPIAAPVFCSAAAAAITASSRSPSKTCSAPSLPFRIVSPVRLDDPPVAVGDDHRSGELVEGAQGDGGFPAQAAQFGMQPSRLREGLQQFLKCGSTGRCERRPVIHMTYAENDYV